MRRETPAEQRRSESGLQQFPRFRFQAYFGAHLFPRSARLHCGIFCRECEICPWTNFRNATLLCQLNRDRDRHQPGCRRRWLLRDHDMGAF